MSGPIQKIVIAGGGTAGWMTAAALSRFLPNNTSIRLIESDAIGTVGVGEATIPPITDFNSMLGIDEDEFLRETKGTFKLGIEFEDWGKLGDRYFHPFSAFGFDVEGISFHHFFMKQRLAGDATSLDEYTLGAHAARAEKFIRPTTQDPQSPVAQMRHAYHIDAGLYAAYLRRYAESRGVVRVEGRISSVDVCNETGNLTGLQLQDGRSESAELFIDCTGFRALLIGEALGIAYDDWSHWLPVDRAVAIPSASATTRAPYTRARAQSSGWQWKIPLQHRNGNGKVYCSAYLRDEEAADQLVGSLDTAALQDPNFLRFQTGKRRQLWAKNCIAIGLSSGFLEPLESTSIHLIQESISKLLALFPTRDFDPLERQHYNDILSRTFEYVRDFIVLHYHATSRDDSEFWNYVRTMPIPQSLTAKIELFRHRGRFFEERGDLFTSTSWVAVMIGQHITPAAYDPLVDAFPEGDVKTTLADIQFAYKEVTARLPEHDAYLSHCCEAAA